MKQTNLYVFILGLSLAGYAWLGWNIYQDNGTQSIMPTCLFKGITHLPCPSCGATRAMVLLEKGYIRESMLTNPFGIVLALMLLIIPFWIIADIYRRSDSFFRWYISVECLLTQNRSISLLALSVVVLNWFWNIAKGL